MAWTGPVQDLSEAFKYSGFLSYNCRDVAIALRLHRALESYVIPHGLACRAPLRGRKLSRLYLDREEITSSPDLGAQLLDALRESYALIVLCSPASAKSRWVNEEIRYFRRLGRSDRIYCVVVEGEPPECFPPALFEDSSSPEPQAKVFNAQPLAADLRGKETGRLARYFQFRREKLRLIAGLLEVDYDTLQRRDRKQASQRQLKLLAVALGILAPTLWWQHSRGEAKLREERVSGLLTQGQQELIAGSSHKAAVSLAAAYREAPTNRDVRLLLGRAMRVFDSRKYAATPCGKSVGILRVALSSGRTRSVALCGDGKVIAWDLRTGKTVLSLDGGAENTDTVAISADGSSVAFSRGSEFTVARVYPGRGRWTGSHQNQVKSIDFAVDGRTIVTASADNTAALWDPISGKLIRVLEGHSATVAAAFFDNTGSRVFTVGNDRTARIWDTSTGRLVSKIGFPRVPYFASISPDRQRLIVVGWPGVSGTYVGLLAFDGQVIAEWRRPARVVSVGFASRQGFAKIVTLESGNRLTVWPLPEEGSTVTLAGHSEMVGIASFSRDANRLVSAGFDRTALIWNLDTGLLESSLDRPYVNGPIDQVANFVDFGPDDQSILSSASDGTVSFWEGIRGERILREHEPGAFYLRYSGDGSRLISADRARLLISTEAGQVEQRFEPSEGIANVYFDPRNEQVLAHSESPPGSAGEAVEV